MAGYDKLNSNEKTTAGHRDTHLPSQNWEAETGSQVSLGYLARPYLKNKIKEKRC